MLILDATNSRDFYALTSHSTAATGRGATTRLVELLREKMEISDRRRSKSLGQRLGFTGIGCCGATWGLRPNNISVRDDDDGEEEVGHGEQEILVAEAGQTVPESGSTVMACLDQNPAAAGSGMNLAAALAAERHFRAAQDSENGPGPSPSSSPVRRPDSERGANNNGGTTAPGTPFRVSLMRLLEETDGYDREMEKEGKGGGVEGCDLVCCVCMGRKKGAAFIPCGHTFCRVCSRELWLNRGFCPLCNRSIIEILDIF